MRHLIPALALLGSLSFTLSAEVAETPAPPVPPAVGGPDANVAEGGHDRRALMKEMMELDLQIRPIREKIQQDPELLKLKAAADDARKAVRTKEDDLMAADPAFAALKTQRDALMGKMTAAGMDPNRPAKKEKEGKPGKDRPAPVVPAPNAPVPAPKL